VPSPTRPWHIDPPCTISLRIPPTLLAGVMTKSPNRPRSDPSGLPKWVKPQLCKLVDTPPRGPEWLHEIKYDGNRVHARLDRGRAQLLTRTGLDWTDKYPSIAAAVSALAARQAYLDGELGRLWRRLQALTSSEMPLDQAPPRSNRFGSPRVAGWSGARDSNGTGGLR
jgi:ATP dependent DNA ligase domain